MYLVFVQVQICGQSLIYMIFSVAIYRKVNYIYSYNYIYNYVIYINIIYQI